MNHTSRRVTRAAVFFAVAACTAWQLPALVGVWLPVDGQAAFLYFELWTIVPIMAGALSVPFGRDLSSRLGNAASGGVGSLVGLLVNLEWAEPLPILVAWTGMAGGAAILLATLGLAIGYGARRVL